MGARRFRPMGARRLEGTRRVRWLVTAEPLASASDRVRREWLRRVEAEYRSAALTQHLGLWLIQVGAAPDLIDTTLRIVGDEMAHAELSHETYRAAGGAQAPHIPRETLELVRGKGPLEHDVLRKGTQIFCLGETIAVRLFERLRRDCTETTARRALDRILRDEVVHRDFGWTLLEWLLETPLASELRAILDRELGAMLRALRISYGGAAAAHPEAMGPDASPEVFEADRAWGLMPAVEYIEAAEQALARDFVPRFAVLGIHDVEARWRGIRR
jgi:hypothetical protein